MGSGLRRNDSVGQMRSLDEQNFLPARRAKIHLAAFTLERFELSTRRPARGI
jgi:hypothetical protein